MVENEQCEVSGSSQNCTVSWGGGKMLENLSDCEFQVVLEAAAV